MCSVRPLFLRSFFVAQLSLVFLNYFYCCFLLALPSRCSVPGLTFWLGHHIKSLLALCKNLKSNQRGLAGERMMKSLHNAQESQRELAFGVAIRRKRALLELSLKPLSQFHEQLKAGAHAGPLFLFNIFCQIACYVYLYELFYQKLCRTE